MPLEEGLLIWDSVFLQRQLFFESESAADSGNGAQFYSASVRVPILLFIYSAHLGETLVDRPISFSEMATQDNKARFRWL